MTLAALPPAIAQAVVAQATAHQVRLGSVRCWRTHSENPPATECVQAVEAAIIGAKNPS